MPLAAAISRTAAAAAPATSAPARRPSDLAIVPATDPSTGTARRVATTPVAEEKGRDLRHLSFAATVAQSSSPSDLGTSIVNPLDAKLGGNLEPAATGMLAGGNVPLAAANSGGMGSSSGAVDFTQNAATFSGGFGGETNAEHSLNDQLAQAPAAGFSANQAMITGEGHRTGKPGLPIDPPVAPPTGPQTPVKPPPAPRTPPVEGSRIVVTGPDAGHAPLVKVFDADTQQLKFSFLAYASSFQGGVRVAVGDVNNDGWDDIITGTGTQGARIRVFDGQTGKRLGGAAGNFDAFSAGLAQGVHVAAGDVNNDGHADIIVGAGEGSLPRVRVFSGLDRSLLADFLVPGLAATGGVRVASADFNQDGYAEIVTAAGPGWNSRVSVFDGWNGARTADFFAFDDLDGGGVHVAAGDVNGDGIPDLVASSGGGQAGWVRSFAGQSLASLHARLPFAEGFTGGVRPALLDGNGDGRLDWLAASGRGSGELRVLDGVTGEALASFQPYGPTFTAGLFVAASPPAGGGGFLGGAGGAGGYSSCSTTVSLEIINPDNFEGSSLTNTVKVVRSGDVSGITTFQISTSGTATAGFFGGDYVDFAVNGTFQAGQTEKSYDVTITDDAEFEGIETIVVTLTSAACVNVGVGVISIGDNDGPQPSPAAAAACGPCNAVDTVKQAQGVGLSGPKATADAPVRYHDGAAAYVATDLASVGFGAEFGVTRGWTNAPGYDVAGWEGNGI